jgi:hypothetical protein
VKPCATGMAPVTANEATSPSERQEIPKEKRTNCQMNESGGSRANVAG